MAEQPTFWQESRPLDSCENILRVISLPNEEKFSFFLTELILFLDIYLA